MMVCESALDHLSSVMGVRPEKLRYENLYENNDKTHYGQQVNVRMKELWRECEKSSKFDERLNQIQLFNSNNKHRKRGISIVPAKFGISFTFLTLNQVFLFIIFFLFYFFIIYFLFIYFFYFLFFHFFYFLFFFIFYFLFFFYFSNKGFCFDSSSH